MIITKKEVRIIMLLNEKTNKTEKRYKKEKRKEIVEHKRLALIKHLELTITKYEGHLHNLEIRMKDARQRGSIGDLRTFTAQYKSKKVFINICKGKVALLKKAKSLTKSEEEKRADAEAKQNNTTFDKTDEYEEDI